MVLFLRPMFRCCQYLREDYAQSLTVRTVIAGYKGFLSLPHERLRRSFPNELVQFQKVTGGKKDFILLTRME